MKIAITSLLILGATDAFTGPMGASKASSTRLQQNIRPLTGGTEGSMIMDNTYTPPSIDAPWGNHPVHMSKVYKGGPRPPSVNPSVQSQGSATGRPGNGNAKFGMTGGIIGSGIIQGGSYGIVDHTVPFSEHYYRVQGIKATVPQQQGAYYPMGLVPPGHKESPQEGSAAPVAQAPPAPVAQAPPAPVAQAPPAPVAEAPPAPVAQAPPAPVAEAPKAPVNPFAQAAPQAQAPPTNPFAKAGAPKAPATNPFAQPAPGAAAAPQVPAEQSHATGTN